MSYRLATNAYDAYFGHFDCDSNVQFLEDLRKWAKICNDGNKVEGYSDYRSAIHFISPPIFPATITPPAFPDGEVRYSLNDHVTSKAHVNLYINKKVVEEQTLVMVRANRGGIVYTIAAPGRLYQQNQQTAYFNSTTFPEWREYCELVWPGIINYIDLTDLTTTQASHIDTMGIAEDHVSRTARDFKRVNHDYLMETLKPIPFNLLPLLEKYWTKENAEKIHTLYKNS